MGSIIGGLFGGDQADAAGEAAGAQVAATRIASQTQKEIADKQIAYLTQSRDLARGDLAPYRTMGSEQLPGLTSLITDPNAQKDFITNNPFFSSLAEQSKNDLFANTAARGKVGSGGTAAAMQDRLLQIGTTLLNNNIGQRYNLVSLGENAAAGSGNAAMQSGQSVSNALGNEANALSNLTLQAGDARASGIMGAANARTNATNNLLSTGLLGAALFL